MYNQSQEYIWKKTPSIKHPTENRYLTINELSTKELEVFRKETYDDLMDSWFNSPEGLVVLKEIEPLVIKKANEITQKIEQELLNENITVEDAMLKTGMAYVNAVNEVTKDNEEYQIVNQTNVRA